MTSSCLRFLGLISLVLGICGLDSSISFAQNSSVQDVLKLKPQWKKLAEEGRRFTFEARFQGRAADAFHVDKLDIDFRLPGSIRLPDRMRDRQKLEITGKFVLNSGRLNFLVSGLVIRDTDLEQLSKQVAAVPEEQSDNLLTIANNYVSIAEFYKDEDLTQEIQAVRLLAIERKRKLAANDPSQLKQVTELARSLNLDQRFLDALRFEILLTEWKQSKDSVEKNAAEAKTLEGWDHRDLLISDAFKSDFPGNAVARYNGGSDADRTILHRLFYEAVRQQQIQKMLKADGSNGLALANLVREEFPRDAVLASMFEEREIAFRLGRIPDLSRQELQQLVELLAKLSRQEKTAEVIADWLTSQEKRFGTVELAGLLRTADEHLFAAENWKDPRHQERGVDLLRQAWSVASVESPNDALQIADRLKRLGWENLNGKWLTTQQVQLLPKDDVQLAIREGRVVKGMTVQQVTQTMGQPARISRVGSSRAMRELWIYDGTGSAGVVIRFRRSLLTKSDERIVEDVSRMTSSSRP